ncbi:MAG TPA: hypothetical protein ENJ84_14950 [Gammaproteobacteria bacterium]|nr:hypothetical protein [Gammaproteobacteria bacterium]
MDQQGKTLIDYLDVLRKEYKLFLVPFVLILFIGSLFALTLPSIYRSVGVILVESQQIPDELVRSTITSYADERIQIIRQIVMTRDNLLGIIEKYNLYEKYRKAGANDTELLDRFKKNIFIELRRGQGPARNRRHNSITFSVAFEHTDRRIAQQVTNELVTLFLRENLKNRTRRATETTEFLSSEAEKLRRKINIIEQQVAEFKQKNERSLPENLDLNNQMLERAQTSLNELEREIKAQQEQISYLEVQLATLENTAPEDGDTPLTPRQQLALSRSQYNRLSQRYGPQHPDLLKLKRQINELERQIQNIDSNETMLDSENPAVLLIQAKIRSSKERIDSLNTQRNTLQIRISELQQRILQTPQVERALKALERDYESLLSKYDDLMNKATEARLSKSMEEQSKAERFTLIESPNFPEEPVRPNRKKLLMLSFILATGIGLGIVYAKDEIRGGIRNVRQLTRLTKTVPLVSIGYIDNNQDEINRWKHLRNSIIGLIALVILIFSLIHYAYKPLDEIIMIIRSRF